MSVQATTWVWEHADCQGSELLVLLAIADAATREGEGSCQSIGTLAKMVRLSKSQVYRIMSDLKDAGLIEATGKHARYRTVIYRLPGVTETTGVRPGDADGVEAEAYGSHGRDPRTDATGVTDATPSVARVRPNPKELTPGERTSTDEGLSLDSSASPAADSADLTDFPDAPEPERHPSRQMTGDWRPRQVWLAYLDATYRHVNVIQSGLRFRNYHLSKQSTSKSWEALLENWVSNDEERVIASIDGGTDELGVPRTQRGASVVGAALKPGDEGYLDPIAAAFSD